LGYIAWRVLLGCIAWCIAWHLLNDNFIIRRLPSLSSTFTPLAPGPTTDGVMASMFWVPTSSAEAKMPGYDYNPLWFCTKDCPPGWPGWRWDQPRAASLGR
jgi:hypothetical protein